MLNNCRWLMLGGRAAVFGQLDGICNGIRQVRHNVHHHLELHAFSCVEQFVILLEPPVPASITSRFATARLRIKNNDVVGFTVFIQVQVVHPHSPLSPLAPGNTPMVMDMDVAR